jgi:hypothetical protein
MKSPLEMEPILQGFDLSTLSSDAIVSYQSLLLYASRPQIKLQAFSLLELLLVLVHIRRRLVMLNFMSAFRFVTQQHHGTRSEHLGQQTEGEPTRRAGGFVPEGTPEFE